MSLLQRLPKNIASPIHPNEAATKAYVDDNSGGGGGSANVVFNIPGGRLTTESGVPISTVDRTNQGTLYYTPAGHNNINTWSGTAWQAKTFSEISLALTITSGKNYDVFINSNADTLSLSAAWTNDTTRANDLGTQDSTPVLASDHTKLWLGTIRASGTNVTEDSAGGSVSQTGGKRFVWNAYNQVARKLSVFDGTASWSYFLSTIRQANGATGNKVEYVTGFSTEMVDATLLSSVLCANSALSTAVGIGVDATTSFSGLVQIAFNASNFFFTLSAKYTGIPGLGYHFLSWNETAGDDAATFLGDFATFNGSPASGMTVIKDG